MLSNSMKYLSAVIILLFISFFVAASECESIYSNEIFYLCAEKNEDSDLFPFPVFDVYAVHLESGNKNFIAHENNINDVSKVIKVTENEFFYKAYMGGNSPPSENRHVLIVSDKVNAKFAGMFSGYEDIDNDNNPDYFLLLLLVTGQARAFDTYKKAKMQLINNKLVVSK